MGDGADRRRKVIPWFQRRPDPRLYYFAVPNAIFDCGINAAEFAIMVYLYSRAARRPDAPNLMTVRKNLSVSRNTLKKYVRRLQERDWILVQHHRFSFPLVLSGKDTILLRDAPRPRVGNFFPMLNSVFGFDLSVGEIAVYGYLLFREDRETFECWPSSNAIGAVLHMSKNTVLKYVHRLEDKGFIETEPTQVQRKDGTRWNGNLKYHIRPIQSVVKAWNEKQAEKAARERMLLRAMKLAGHRPGFTVQPGIPEGRG